MDNRQIQQSGFGFLALIVTFGMVALLFYLMVLGLRSANEDELDALDRIEAVDRAAEARDQLERNFYQYP